MQAIDTKIKGFGKSIDEWAKKQHPAVEVGVVGLQGAAQGGVIGAAMGYVMKMDPSKPSPFMPPGMDPGSMNGPMYAIGQARNFAVMTGVNAGLNLAIKKARNGVEDAKGCMLASFGSGACFAIVSGAAKGDQLVPSATSTGVLFALMQGGLYLVQKAFPGKGQNVIPEDSRFIHTKHLLNSIGMSHYEKNFKKGLLTDDTLPLLSETALQECRIPPGPRLLILSHAKAYTAANYNAEDVVVEMVMEQQQ